MTLVGGGGLGADSDQNVQRRESQPERNLTLSDSR